MKEYANRVPGRVVVADVDCDDNDPNINPGGQEIPQRHIDQNGNGDLNS
jgi:hypothetical protein